MPVQLPPPPLPQAPPPPPASDAAGGRSTDERHLDQLAIFHFLSAGLSGVGLIILVIQFVILTKFFANPEIWMRAMPEREGLPPEGKALFAGFFEVFKWFLLVMGIWSAAGLVLNLVAGFDLRNRRRRTLSLVVGAVNCLSVPLGTVLGVFTILVLSRDSVVELYGGAGDAGRGG